MNGLTDSPDAVGELIDALEAEAGEGTSETPPNPDGGEKDGQGAAGDGGQNQDTKDAGTTEQKPVEGEATPEAKQKQSPFPKALEPFKATLEAKKWDPTKPDWFVEPLKALQESEALIGRQGTDLGLTRTRVTEMLGALHGTAKDINDMRARAGLPALPFDATSIEDKLKAAEGEWDLLEKAMSDDEKVAGPALKQIVGALRKRMEDLRLEKAVQDKTGTKPADTGKEAQTENWNRIREQFPDATAKLTALVPFLQTKYGMGLLGSFGVTPESLMSSPQRAKAAYELAERVWRGSPENFQAEVKKAVQAEMEKLRKAGNTGAIVGGGSPAQPTQKTKTDTSAVEDHLAGMFNRGSDDD